MFRLGPTDVGSDFGVLHPLFDICVQIADRLMLPTGPRLRSPTQLTW